MSFIEFVLDKYKLIGLIAIVVAIVHKIFKKNRWQYYPLYILGLLYCILTLLNYFEILVLSPNIAKWILGIGIILITSSIFFLLIFPMEKLPIPSGKFKIGTRTYELEGESRDEIYSELEDDKRKIKYQIWYPADKTEGYKKAKWINEGILLTRQVNKNMNIPDFLLDHTVEINSNSYSNAPINNELESYPVVIISHGWKGFRELHTDYAEELASNGFIAISIDHTYGSQVVRFEDGSIAYLNKEALPKELAPPKYNYASSILVATYGEDVASVLDDLEKLNRINQDFKGKLNLEKIGLLGHSTGGGGDVYISLKDKRIKALLGLDAWVNPIESTKLKQGLSIPSLFLRSEQWGVGPNNNALKDIMTNSDDATLIQMNKTNHIDFSMSYMYSPLTKYIGFTGKFPGRQSSEIQREFIIEFFDENLRNNEDFNKNYLEDIVDKYDFLEFVDMQ